MKGSHVMSKSEYDKLHSLQYVIRDLQTNDFTYHTNIAGLFEMLADDWLNNSDFNEAEKRIEQHRLDQFSIGEQKRWTEKWGYEYCVPTQDLIREWEDYTEMDFNYQQNSNIKNVVFYVGPNNIGSATANDVFLVYENIQNVKVGFSPTDGYFSFGKLDLEILSKCKEISVDRYKTLSTGYETPVDLLENAEAHGTNRSKINQVKKRKVNRQELER